MSEVVLGEQVARDGQDVEVTTRFGRPIPMGKVRELFPYGFASRSKKGTVVVFFEGGDVRSPILMPISDLEGAPDLEDGDSALWTANGGWIIAREAGTVELFGTEEGGLVKAKELRTQLEKTNAVVQTILTIINGAPIPEAGNGSPSSLQGALKEAMIGKDVGVFSGLESEKVFHGGA